MSQENVEIVRKMYDGFSRAGVEGMFEFMDPDVDHRAIEGAPDDIGVFSGYDAMRRYYGEWLEMFDDLHMVAEELTDVSEQVVAAVHVTAGLRGSRSKIDMRLGVVWTLRDGRILHGREYATREEALEAVGLRG